jgi:hypothetical protein
MPNSKRASGLSDNPFKLLANLCDEAVARHGSDWRGVEQYIADRLQHMGADERDQMTAKVREILKLAGSQRQSDSVH